ncbi:hypothetical protein GGU11DRAFT_69062 [Lentinula aff. detonsa]|uniref:Yeast cell wall synthesis Kre9/Knh1-like N-terminal domain-containing protein n=1 Tax=Lentinula aff. detonsa TaxID=2804958 RepID=A0AA38KTB5_9AGAR|nr:hypothetical protein GGU10DRAFT_163233 [Lentinula aff. detonsa]KAJ3797460.1 hypothetical protein GGU11DRAFT_69062 [Lentinula aff. detonsa]
MVSLFSFVVLSAAAASTLLARADIVPDTPSTGNAGSTCSITWTGDSSSSSNWSNMAIEFMTGDNFDMVFLTTVATGLDGTKSGSYSWTCPEVTIYSAIYFYQFISPAETGDPVWTTRFAIASSSGETTTPPNSTQPDGETIAWGNGALVNPSSASAAPSFASGVTSGSVPATSASVSSSSSSAITTTTPATTTASARGTTSVVTVSGNTSGAASAKTVTPVVTTGADQAAATSSSANANAGLGLAVDARMWSAAIGVMSTAMTLALFL